MTKDERMYEFGIRLNAFMSEANINGASLQDISGISHTEITRARRGVLMPTREYARQLAIVLGKPEDSFDDLYLPDYIDDEEWRPLKRYPEYMGSSKGRIMNPNTGRIMRNVNDKRGRPKIQLHINGKTHSARIQDLIDETFE